MGKRNIFWLMSGSWCYYLSNPRRFLRDLRLSFRFAWQRVYRGWDDGAVWGLDWWLCENLPDIIEEIKANKVGTSGIFVKNTRDQITSEDWKEADRRRDEDWKEADRRQDEALDVMIEGFRAGMRILNLGGDEMTYEEWKLQEKEDEKKFRKGMAYFSKYFFSLWT